MLARQVGAKVRIVDMGVQSDLGHLPNLIVQKVGLGTKNFAEGPAMSQDEAVQSIEIGIPACSGCLCGRNSSSRAWGNGHWEYDRQ